MHGDITFRSRALVSRLERKLAMKETISGRYEDQHVRETLIKDDAFNFPRVSHHIEVKEDAR